MFTMDWIEKQQAFETMNKSTILYLPTNRSYHAALPAALILACAMLPASGVTEIDHSNNSGYQANVPATSAI